MARNQFEEALKSILAGGLQGAQTGMASGREMEKALMLERLKQQFNPPEYKPRTMGEALEFERAKAGIIKPAQVAQERKTILQTQKLEQEQQDVERKTKLQSQGVVDSATDMLNTIGEVKKGIGYFGIGGLIPAVPGLQPTKIKWEANLGKLLSGKIVNLMTEMKNASKTGATGFGQLSEKELKVLQDASTALKKTMSPKDALSILNDMEMKLYKITGGAGNPTITMGNDLGLKIQKAKQLGYSDEQIQNYLRTKNAR